ncbi:MAG TPA: winged helix-turn-helix domain-containing protein [Pyrinomonadaceae bacterium]|nr:winged helix-turn-helix domain-containing protein [Pyrinomonadaceae bacterium]
MSRQAKHFYEFGDFRLDVAERVLLRDGEIVPLTAKAFEVLLVLVERSGQIAGKEELMGRVWPDSFVEESNLAQNIYTLRKVLGQTPDGQEYIKTVPRRGYRFGVGVREWWDESEEVNVPIAAGVAQKGVKEIGGSASEEFPDFVIDPEADKAAIESEVSAERATQTNETLSTGRAQSANITGGGLIDSLRRRRGTGAILVGVLLLAAGATLWSSRIANRKKVKVDAAESSPEITISNLTTAGNVACAAVSPDGNYVAYATNDNPQMSSLWIEQLATSTRRHVIPPTEIRYHALTFSPDGNYIYYVALTKDDPDRRTLYRVSVLGGPAKKLIEGVETAVSFSPDRAQFAFRRSLSESRRSVLFVANADGSGEREVASLRYPEMFYDPAWSPDGSVIACAAGNPEGVASMYVVAVSVGDWTMRKFSTQAWQWVGQMAWLADSRGLVMVAAHHSAASRQVWRLTYPGGEARKVTNDSNVYNRLSLGAESGVLAALQVKQVSNVWVMPAGDAGGAKQITFGAGGYRGGISWTPDGKLVYDSEAGSAKTISVMDADGSNPQQLTGNMAGGVRVGNAPASPDGRHIVFVSYQTGERHIWRMNTDGGDPVQLTNGSGEDDPYFSPDGRWVYYTKIERGGTDRPVIGRVSIDGGALEELTDEFTAYPAVSPDGKSIACLRAEGPGDFPWQMAVYRSAGGRPLKVFPQTVLAQYVRWTPDGRGIIYTENPVAGASKILVQPLDGGATVQLAEFGTDRVFGLDWSRDGRRLAYVRGLWTANVVLIKGIR